MQRGRPFGQPEWQKEIAKRLGLESAYRPTGPPAKGRPKSRCLARVKIARTSVGPPSLRGRKRDRSVLLSQATFLLAHIANSGPVPLSAPRPAFRSGTRPAFRSQIDEFERLEIWRFSDLPLLRQMFKCHTSVFTTTNRGESFVASPPWRLSWPNIQTPRVILARRRLSERPVGMISRPAVS